MLSVTQGSCEYQSYSGWLDPTWNQIRVYSSSDGRIYHSAICAFKYINTSQYFNALMYIDLQTKRFPEIAFDFTAKQNLRVY